MSVGAFPLLRRAALSAALAAMACLQACGCLRSDGPISSYHFSVLHPRAVVVYKPVDGTPPETDVAIIYLAIQNDSEGPQSMCFACYSKSNKDWYRWFSHDVVPAVQVTSVNAPIVGAPEVRVYGASGETVGPGRRFPDIIPDPSEFPLNEAHYRRDFAIVVHPDRTRAGDAGGELAVTVTLTRPKEPRPDDGHAQIATFRIPVKIISDQWRPETMTIETSQP
ncbi:hypothetical protein AB4Y44_27920 [Paraburkholderia sp. BR10937]|uniref:hypothetical protein n=1 Tax=Paraburkholderia sp. BR10937 TaxID=3236994 RepID=UPI0034D32E29